MSRHSPYTIRGSLAAALLDATADLQRVERDVEDLLAALFPEWRPLFPAERAWRFTAPDVIDVYGVTDSPANVSGLHMAGFRRVTVHDHRRGEACRCDPRVDQRKDEDGDMGEASAALKPEDV